MSKAVSAAEFHVACSISQTGYPLLRSLREDFFLDQLQPEASPANLGTCADRWYMMLSSANIADVGLEQGIGNPVQDYSSTFGWKPREVNPCLSHGETTPLYTNPAFISPIA